MSTKFLYIIDPLSTLNATTDTTLAIIQEASTRDIKNFVGEIGGLVLKGGELFIWAQPVSIKREYHEPPLPTCARELYAAAEFDAIFMRKDPPVDEAFVSALLMLRHGAGAKTIMINHPDGLLNANEKLFGLSIVPQFFPPTIVTQTRADLMDFLMVHETIAMKPLFGAGGAGVLIFRQDDRNLSSAFELLSANYSRPVIVQSYIKTAREGDKRIFIVGGKACGAILRVPSANDHRANFHAGGTPQATELTRREEEIVEALSPHLLKRGLHLVGIDVIGGFLTEINVTSPTCVIEIEKFSQHKEERLLRAQIVDYVEKLLA